MRSLSLASQSAVKCTSQVKRKIYLRSARGICPDVGKHAKNNQIGIMKINFQCKELTIQDQDLGCTITFSDSTSADDQFKTVEEIMNSDEKYLLIQRTYAEDDDDTDFYHFESTELDFEPDEKMIVNLRKDKFEADCYGGQLTIGLNLKSKELEDLTHILETKFTERIRIEKK
jgi:hypothetical protein